LCTPDIRGEQIKEDKMDHVARIKFYSGNLKGRGHLEYVRVDGRIILERTVE